MASLALGVKFVPAAGGLTDWVYSATVQGYVNPTTSPEMVNGKTYRYRAENAALNEWEYGTGVWSTGTNTLTRVTISLSSTGSKVSFAAAPQVGIIQNVADVLQFDDAMALTDAQQAQARANINAGEIGEGLGLANISFTFSAAAGALTITMNDGAGNAPTAASPIAINFRDAAAGNPSTLTRLLITSAQTITIPSTSTLGVVANTAFRLWITGWNDGGTFRLGVINCSGGNDIYPLTEAIPTSSLQVVAAGNSLGQHYTAGAAVTTKAFRILGYAEWSSTGLATPGTWVKAGFLTVQNFGPGMYKPGDVVQKHLMGSNTTTTTTAVLGAAAATNLTKAITPTSAANLIKIRAIGVTGTNGAAVASSCQIGRNSNASLIGSLGNYFASTTVGNTTQAIEAIDKPNTATSTTYTVYLWSSSSGTSVYYLNGAFGTLTVEELMG